jgi:diaminopropionate ammonia-lyase
LLVERWDNPDRAAVPPTAPDLDALAFHRGLPGYAPTPLVEAPATARALGLDHLYVKLETERLGLPSFKVLGASWAAHKALRGRTDVTLVAATDGNHGRAVARVARLIGARAHILVPAGMAPARAQAIAGEGARVETVDGTYDEAVERAAALADEDHVVIQDTAWPGYTDVPRWIVDGYATIFAELAEQLPQTPPLVAIQIGVGSLATAAVRALAPVARMVAVEPADAACALRALRDGATAPGPHRSVMAGLNAGVASPLALPELRRGIDTFVSVTDAAAEQAVRLLHEDGIAAGETGAAGVAGLLALGAGGSALTVCTEGPTDPAGFARILA